MSISIERISPDLAQTLCQKLTSELPDYFGLEEANEQYFQGMMTRESWGAKKDDQWVGLITLEFPYPGNGNIYWMGVSPLFHGQGIGTALIQRVHGYAFSQGAKTLTLETLSPDVGDANYLKTYRFYEKCGFRPLFNLKPQGYDYSMVYMQKSLSLDQFRKVDLTYPLHSAIPTWDGHCGFKHQITMDYHEGEGDGKFRVQEVMMQAGIGTHMDAPQHCIPGGKEISELDLSQLVVPWIVIDVSLLTHEKFTLSVDHIQAFEETYGMIPPGCFVLIYTGWSQFWTTPTKYRNNHIFPSISVEAAQWLLQREIVGLGIDTLSPDRPEDGFPVHQLILGAGKYLIENVAHGDQLPPMGSYGLALPIPIVGGTEAPIRLVAMVP